MASRFSGEQYDRSRDETEHLERAMRSILKMFADGALTYRRREQTVKVDIGSRSDRIRRLRAQPTAAPAAAV